MAKRTPSKKWKVRAESKAKSKNKAQFQYKKNRRQKCLERFQNMEANSNMPWEERTQSPPHVQSS